MARSNVELQYIGGKEVSIPYTDFLNKKGCPFRGPCNSGKCKGSMLERQSRRTLTDLEKENQMVTFFDDYYDDLENTNPTKSKMDRLEEVAKELSETESYEHTTDELAWSAKTAWRNAARCAGRSMWKSLVVKDERKLSTCEEIFTAICSNLRETYNGGSIIPTAVIFDQRRDDTRPGIRIWNDLILSFAGHLLPNGDVYGDPKNVYLANLAKDNGWKPEYTAFDILPLIITDRNEVTRCFELPADIRNYVVSIKHSEIPAISDLALKWYGIPSVSNMMLEAGGIQYTAAPIAGFFQDTEISVMDLLNPSRYNTLEAVGLAMKLDITNNTSFWKSQVGLEFNRAVYESYKSSNVAIIDHFTISDRFLSFMKGEMETRGGCPSDWVWVVPPLSSGLVPTFHQEMIRYTLSPSYEYQMSAEEYFAKKRKKYSFSAVAWTVLLFSSWLQRAARHRKQLSIVYATETGTARDFATSCLGMFEYGFLVNIMSMNDINSDAASFYQKLKDCCCAIFICSTSGEGEPPLMGQKFAEHLADLRNGMVLDWTKDLNFAVFALGSSDYPNFAAFGKEIHRTLSGVGCNPISELGIGDDTKDQASDFAVWIKSVFNTCCSRHIHTDTSRLTHIAKTTTLFRWKLESPTPLKLSLQDKIGNIGRLIKFTVKHKKLLSKEKNDTKFLRLDLTSVDMPNYFPGDHLAILPKNSEKNIKLVLEKLVGNPFANISYRLETKVNGSGTWYTSNYPTGVNFSDFLSYFVDLHHLPTDRLVSYLQSRLNDWIVERDFTSITTLDDLFQMIPDRILDSPGFVGCLNETSRRLYSIASRCSRTPQVSIIASMAQFEKDGRTHLGFCSEHLQSLSEGDTVYGYILSNNMRLNKDPSKPMILVANGSGYAPFRSFLQCLQYEASLGQEVGEIFLFFGCQTKNHMIYEEDIESIKKFQIRITVHVALSRQPEIPKKYVQDVIKENASIISHSLVAEKGSMYVCGGQNMAKAVEASVSAILSKSSPVITVEGLMEEGRYQTECYS